MRRPVEVLPIIIPQDYEVFRSLSGSDLPGTYEEWHQLHRNRSRELIQAGADINECQIDAQEFIQFCRTAEIATDRHALWQCAVSKAAGETL